MIKSRQCRSLKSGKLTLEEGGDNMLEILTQIGIDVVAIVVGGLILDYIVNKRR